MPEVRIKDIDEHDIDTILAEDIDFEGQLTFKKPLMVKGKFKGEIKSTSSLYVGEKAYVEARIESDLVSSRGKIRGDILGHSRVELFSTAEVDGDITVPDFVVESGCKFNGYCNMGGGMPRKESAPPPQAVHNPVQPRAPEKTGNQQAPSAQNHQVPHVQTPQQGQQKPPAPQGGTRI